MQTDVLTLLRNGRWKQDGGLIIPGHVTKYTLSVSDVSTAVFLTHTEVLGEKYTQEQLKEDFAQLSVGDCIILASKLLTVLENEKYLNANAQKGLAQGLFVGNIKEKVLDILNNESNRVVFFETQLLLFAKYAMLFAKDESPNDFMGWILIPLCMKILLGITDLLAERTEGYTEPEIQRSAIRSMYFTSSPDFLHAIRRTEELFIDMPDELRTHHQYLDIPSLFHEATGLTLEDYIFLGVSLTALPMEQSPGHLKEENWYVDPTTYFSKTLVSKEEIDLLIKEFTTDTGTLQTLFRNQANFEYNFNGLVQHPLVTFDQTKFFPLGLGVLKDKITLQVYWILFDHIKKTYGDEKLNRYTNFMGPCFEEYIYRQLRRMYPSSPLLGERLVREISYISPRISRKSQVKTADNILINPSSLILVETKVSQLQVYQTGIVGDLNAFRKDVRKIVVDSFKTIQRTKEDIQAGLLSKELSIEPASIKTFYPVVVTYGKFIMFPLVWNIIEEEIKNIQDGYDAELLDKLQIIQEEELELIEAFLEKTGMSFVVLL